MVCELLYEDSVFVQGGCVKFEDEERRRRRRWMAIWDDSNTVIVKGKAVVHRTAVKKG